MDTEQRNPSLALGAVCLAAASLVVVAQILSLGELMDVQLPLNAGNSKGLVAAYGAAALTLVGATALLPARLLWVPVAATAAFASGILLLTLPLAGELWSFAWAVLTLAVCWRVGRWALDVVRAGTPASSAPVAWLAGAGVMGLALLAIGRAGLLSWWTAGLPVLVIGVMGVAGLWRELGPAGTRRAWSAMTSTRLAAASAALCLLSVGLAAIWTAAPDLMFDHLYYKGWLPHEWARTGEISPEPLREHALINFWGLSQVLAIPGHLAGAEGVGKYMQWLAQCALVATVWWAGRRSAWAPLAAAALALCPLLFWQATTGYDDAVLTLAGVAMALAVLRALEEPDASPLRTGLVLGGLAGACAALKVHLAPLALGLLLGWLVMRGRSRWPAAVTGAGLGTLLIGGPLFLMRWIDLENPILAAYNDVFESPYWFPINETTGFPWLADPGALGPLSTLWYTVGDTFRLEQSQGAFGVLSLAVAVALLFGWRVDRDRRGTAALWVGVLAASVIWYLKFRYARYLLPFSAVALMIIVLRSGVRPPGPRAQLVALALLAASAVLTWPSTVSQFWNLPDRGMPWQAAFGRIGDQEYERNATPDRALVELLDQHAPSDAVAAADAHERLWLEDDRDLVPYWELKARIELAGPVPRTPAETLAAVRGIGITWVLGGEAGGLAELPYLERMVDVYGEPVAVSPGGTLYRLPDAPVRPPGPG